MKLRAIFFLLAAGYSATAASITTNQSANSVLGQASFTASTPNFTAATMHTPRAVAVDPTTGKFYVADRDNNRVLRFTSAKAFASGAAAERVLGQTSLTVGGFNSASDSTMFHPGGLAFDSAGRLYVADTGFNRVLRFDAPSAAVTDGIAAIRVLGQPDFTTTTATITSSGMNAPASLTVGTTYLWVADSENNRVIGFLNPDTANNGAAAVKVLGQTALNLKAAPANPTAATMNSPEGVTISSQGVIWVSDTDNHRVLRFAANPAATGTSANLVLGQPNSTTNTVPSAVTAANLYAPEGLALDESGATISLWVVDRVHDRVVRYDDVSAIANGADASVALGQPNLLSEGSNTTRRGMDSPYGVTVDSFNIVDSPKTIWVADASNNRVLRFTPAVPAPPIPAGPTIAGATKYKTKKSKVVVSGSASGAAGLTQVKYKGGKGGYRAAAGTTRWSFKAKCKPGKNRFIVIAVDARGRSSAPLTVIVKRAN